MKEKIALIVTLLAILLGLYFAQLASDSEEISIHPVAKYKSSHLVNCGDSNYLKKKAHFYSQQLKRKELDIEQQLSWLDGCKKELKPFYDAQCSKIAMLNNHSTEPCILGYKAVMDTSCSLGMKESEEDQRERVGDGISSFGTVLLPAVLLLKNLGGF